MITINRTSMFFVFFINFLTFSTPIHALNEGSECTADNTSSGNCYVTPTDVSINLKGIWYCYGEPAAPTSTLPNPAQGAKTTPVRGTIARNNPGNAVIQTSGTGCNSRNFNGSTDITINEGGASAVPASGAGQSQSFQWVVLQISPSISMTASFEFDNVKKTSATSFPTSTASTPSVTTGGKFCYTVGKDAILVTNGGTTSVECSSVNNPQANTYIFNRLGEKNYFTWTLSNGKTAKAWLTDSNNRLADGLTQAEQLTLQGQVPGARSASLDDPFITDYNAEIAAGASTSERATSIFVAFENPWRWNKCANRRKGTKSIDLSWYVTNALRFDMASSTQIAQADPAAFDMFLTTTLKVDGEC